MGDPNHSLRQVSRSTENEIVKPKKLNKSTSQLLAVGLQFVKEERPF